jgi:hypothetical protein
MNLRIITYPDTLIGFEYFIKCNIFEFCKNTENVKGLKSNNTYNIQYLIIHKTTEMNKD